MSMLVRRGFHPASTRPDLPFPPDLSEERAARLSDLMASYAFRLFLRGAILKPKGFTPGETTRYLKTSQAKNYAGMLVELGLVQKLTGGRYRWLQPARSFGGVLEWYVARELRCRYTFDVITGVKLRVSGVGGDFDVVAAAEGKLVYLELKSSPPKNLMVAEVGAFFDRLRVLRPDLALFVVDTALRLSDKILPMLLEEMERGLGRKPDRPQQIAPELWALTSNLYAVNGRRDLIANIGRAIACGLLARTPAL